MDSHECLEEVHVGEFARLRAKPAHGESLLDRIADLRLVLPLDPNEDPRHIVLLQGLAGRRDDWAVHATAREGPTARAPITLAATASSIV